MKGVLGLMTRHTGSAGAKISPHSEAEQTLWPEMPGQTPLPRFQLHQAGHLQAFPGSARHVRASRPCPDFSHS